MEFKQALIIIIFLTGKISAQFYNSFNPADSAQIMGNYKLSLTLNLENIKETDEIKRIFHWSYLYNLAVCYAMTGNKDSAFFHLTGAINAGKDNSLAVNDLELNSLHTDSRWPDIIEKLKLQYLKYHPSVLNKELGFELQCMDATDQTYRGGYYYYEKFYGKGSHKLDSIWKLQERFDSINIVRLNSIVTEYGWPTRSLVGNDGARAAFIIVQHSNLEMQKKYFPLIEAAANKGEASLEGVALLKDRILMRENKKQIYGSQLKRNEAGGFDLYPIEDEANVDQRRSSMGLEPLANYVKEYGIIYKPVSSDSLQAPSFKGATIFGDSIFFNQLKENVLVLNFWATWCKPCLEEIPLLNKLVAKYLYVADVKFIAVTEEGAIWVTKFFIDKNIYFSYRQIVNGQAIIKNFVDSKLKAKGFGELSNSDVRPANIIINKKGNVQYYTVGNLDGQRLNDFEREIISAKLAK